ncbi:hypothetical protein SAMN05444920_102425 [Nonomuraea solani]|uniref:DUF3558 domain-containing protein n=1 Tax=Nonomuraea solani TaxID=1144553 RepID=A0A1H5YX45_9ACTN|nr:hypothetical protein [Nonomuraea solani]SEG27766.1 hypothetical protein SAMN05444920_102425 [Nonomuraea solani]
MKNRSLLIMAVLTLTTACSSSSAPPPDDRPLGDVTAMPRECELISADAIKIATGLNDYSAHGTKIDMGRRFGSCSVSAELDPESDQGLLIEVFEPSPISPEGLANTKVTTQGNDLPEGLGPGFAARRKNAQDQGLAFVYGWTAGYERLLSINIMEGAPGRDSLADAIEFFRQLKPLLLAPPE